MTQDTPASSTPAEDAALAARINAIEDRIRETAKWLVASLAGVGAAMIAGSQLSSIGQLPVCTEASLECGRLWVALLGAAVALTAVAFAIWMGVTLLAPVRLPLSELKARWKPGNPIYEYFAANPAQLQGFGDLDDIEKQEAEAYQLFDRLNAELSRHTGPTKTLEDRLDEAEARLKDLLRRSDHVVTIANHADYIHLFKRRAIPMLFRGAAITALGVVAFAWAANPGPASPSAALRGADLSEAQLVGVDLSGADLRDATLNGANLTDADLEGADLTGADLDDVTWSGTTCPDGTNSDAAGNSCENRLDPAEEHRSD